MAFGTIETGSGVWNAIIWLAALALIMIMIYIFYRRGESAYKSGTEQTVPFLSGNLGEDEALQIKASNIYWGFITALKGYYIPMKSIHTGNINDYASWFILTMALILILITITEVSI